MADLAEKIKRLLSKSGGETEKKIRKKLMGYNTSGEHNSLATI